MRAAVALSLLIVGAMIIAARIHATPDQPKQPTPLPSHWRHTIDGWERTDGWQNAGRAALAEMEPPGLPHPLVISAAELLAAVLALAASERVRSSQYRVPNRQDD
jgi:hypothetical protein